MKKRSLFIVFALAINFVQTQQNIAAYGEDNIQVLTYNNISTPANNIHFGDVDVKFSRVITFRVTGISNDILSFFGINLSSPQIGGLNATGYSVTNRVKSHLNINKFTKPTITLSHTFIGIKTALISFTSMVRSCTLPQNSFNFLTIVNAPIIDVFDDSVRIEIQNLFL